MPTDIEKAIAVIQKTNDGDNLAPSDLYLTECAVNGFLTPKGKETFDDLYHRVSEDRYIKPWLFGIENLTIDHIGFVYWKGHEVEHYTFYPGKSEDLRKQAVELARRCRILEERGVEVGVGSAVWNWKD